MILWLTIVCIAFVVAIFIAAVATQIWASE